MRTISIGIIVFLLAGIAILIADFFDVIDAKYLYNRALALLPELNGRIELPERAMSEARISNDQSTGASDYVRKYKTTGAAFEPVRTYDESFPWRKAANSVGSLRVLWEDKNKTKKIVIPCTAFVVSNQEIMTAAHCLDPKPGKGQERIISINFLLGYLHETDALVAVENNAEERERVLQSGYRVYKVDPIPSEIALEKGRDKNKLDVALLTVEFGDISKIPEFDRPTPVKLVETSPHKDQRFYILHHPQDDPLLLTAYDCRIAEHRIREKSKDGEVVERIEGQIRNRTFGHTCDTRGGSSGAPVFAVPGDYVVGVHIAGADARVNDQDPNWAVRMDQIAQWSRKDSTGKVASLIQPKPFSPREVDRMRRLVQYSEFSGRRGNKDLAAVLAFSAFPRSTWGSKELPPESAEAQAALIKAMSEMREKNLVKIGAYANGLEYSSDEKEILTYGDEGTKRISTETGEIIRSIGTEQNLVLQAKYVDDEQKVLTIELPSINLEDLNSKPHEEWTEAEKNLYGEAMQGRVLRLWDSQTGSLLKTLNLGTKYRVFDSAPYGNSLKAVDEAGEIYVISSDLAEPQHLVTLKSVPGRLTSSPDGTLLVLARGNSVSVVSTVSGDENYSLEGHTGIINAASFSPNGEMIATASEWSVRIWDAKTGKEVWQYERDGSPVTAVEFSPDGKWLAAGIFGKVHVFDFQSEEKSKISFRCPGYINEIKFSPSQDQIACVTDEGSVAVFDIRPLGQSIHPLEPIDRYGPMIGYAANGFTIGHADLSPDGNSIGFGGYNQFDVFDLRSGELATKLNWDDDYYLSDFRFFPDGKRIVAMDSKHPEIRVWNLETGEISMSLNPEPVEGLVLDADSLALSPDGKLIAAAHDETYAITVWNAETGEKVAFFEAGPHFERENKNSYSIWDIEFLQDGRTIVTAGRDGAIRFLDIETQTQTKALFGQAWAILNVAFSADEKTMASSASDKTIRVWDVESGQTKKIIRLTESGSSSWELDISPDGQRILSGDSDGNIRLWDAKSGKQLALYDQHEKTITAVRFLDSDQFFLSSSTDGLAALWSVPLPAQGLLPTAAEILRKKGRLQGDVLITEGGCEDFQDLENVCGPNGLANVEVE